MSRADENDGGTRRRTTRAFLTRGLNGEEARVLRRRFGVERPADPDDVALPGWWPGRGENGPEGSGGASAVPAAMPPRVGDRVADDAVPPAGGRPPARAGLAGT